MKDKNSNEVLDKSIIWWKTTIHHCKYGKIESNSYEKNLFYIYSVHDEYIGKQNSLKSAKNFLKEVFQSDKKYWCSNCQDFKNDGEHSNFYGTIFHCTCLDCKSSDLIYLETQNEI